jgi:hypothetical protein
MKGYIYTMFRGADPGVGWKMTDPLFGKVPTLGACMPNIRRAVVPGDYVFVVSGLVPGVQQYVVGGFRVAEKINALEAFERFPGNRMRKLNDESLAGNVIVTSDGKQNKLDYHSNFEKRIENYIVGRDPIALESHEEIESGREQTLEVLGEVFKSKAKSVHDVIARWRRLDEKQIDSLVGWLRDIKQEG